MQEAGAAKRWFIGLWLALLALKLWLAARLPLFVDEAFYWQEGRHLAWAYSDLPGLTAWLARSGDLLGGAMPGARELALRLPFLTIAAAIPWLIVKMTAREFDARTGWLAGTLALLLPLAGSMGLLALPDVPLLLASVLCMDAGLRLLRGVDSVAALELAAGLIIGGLTHYRFAAVIAVGFVALMLLREGRIALRDPRVWAAVLAGALAWLPLLLWNLHNGDAGLRFQLVDRHPWSFSNEGFGLGGMQLLAATPVLLAAMAVAAWRGVGDARPAVRYLALSGAMIVLGFVALGFFADRDRVSFHWTLPGYLALVPMVPDVLSGWSRRWRGAMWALAAAGLTLVLAYYAVASTPALRAQLAFGKFHPGNFAGWHALDIAVRDTLESMPANTRLLAGNFKVGAELGFARNDAQIAVLDHPVNHKHGRAPQLALWGLSHDGRRDSPMLLVVAADDVKFSELLAHYQQLCRQVGALPPPRILNIDHGSRRFLLFALGAAPLPGPCTTPSMAFIDTPAPSARANASFEVAGWAFKDGVGLHAVEVMLDGRVVAQARYGEVNAGVADFWKISTDPNHPRVYFRAQVEGASVGSHWLGLRLHGADGSVEDWSEQKIEVR